MAFIVDLHVEDDIDVAEAKLKKLSAEVSKDHPYKISVPKSNVIEAQAQLQKMQALLRPEGKESPHVTKLIRQQVELEETLKVVNAETLRSISISKLKLHALNAEEAAYMKNRKATIDASAALNQFDSAAERQLVIMRKQLEAERAQAEAMARQTTEYKRAQAQLDRLAAAEERAAGASKKGAASRFLGSQATTAFRASLQGLQANIGIYTSSTIVAAAASYKLMQGIRDTLKTGIDFTRQMSVVKAVMGASSQQMQVLEGETKRLGATTQLTASEVAQGLRELGMAGLSTQESFLALEPVLKLSIIGALNFGTAADIATNIMTGFNLEAVDLTRVVDVMASAVTNSNMNIQQMGNALSYAAPLAEAYGVSLEAASASLEILANAGIKASRGGTTLRRVIDSLYTPSEKGAKAFDRIGVSATDMYGKTLPLVDVFEQLKKAMDEGRASMQDLQDIVEIRALPGFARIISASDGSARGLRNLTLQLEKASGAANTMSSIIADNLYGDLKQLESALENLQLKIFADAEGPLREFTQVLTASVRAFGENEGAVVHLLGAIKELLTFIGLLIGTSAFLGLYNLLGRLLGPVGKLIPSLANLKTTMQLLPAVFESWGAALLISATATKKLGQGVLALLGPVGRLIAIGWLAYEMFEDLFSLILDGSDSFDKGKEKVKSFTEQVKELTKVAGQPQKNLEMLAKLKIELPKNLEEQKKQLDELTKKHEELKSIEKEMGDNPTYLKMLKDSAEGLEGFTRKVEESTIAVTANEKAMAEAKVSIAKSLLAKDTAALREAQDILAEQRRLLEESMAGGGPANPRYVEGVRLASETINAMTWVLAKETDEMYKAEAASRAASAALEDLGEKSRKASEQKQVGSNVLDLVPKVEELQKRLGMDQMEILIADLKKAQDEFNELISLKEKLQQTGQLSPVEANRMRELLEAGPDLVEKIRSGNEQILRLQKEQERVAESLLKKEIEREKQAREIAKAEHEAVVANRDSYKLLEESSGIDYAGLGDLLRGYREEVVKTRITQEKALGAYDGTRRGAELLKSATQNLTDAMSDFAETKKAREALEDLAGKYDKTYEAAIKLERGLKDIQEAVDSGILPTEKAADATYRLRREMALLASENQIVHTLQQWADELINLDKVGADWLSKFADAVADFATGAKDSFKNFFSYVKRSLIELATRQFIVQVAGSFGVGPGILGLGTTGVPNLLGGASGLLSSAGSASNSLSLLDTIATGFGKTLGSVGSAIGSLFGGTSFGAGSSLGGMVLAQEGIGSYLGGMGSLGSMTGLASVGYLMPIVGTVLAAFTALGGFSKLFGDKTEPRIQLLATASRDNPTWFEDNVHVKTPFTDIGLGGASHGVDANAFSSIFDAFKKLDESIASAIGDESVGKIKAAIETSWAKWGGAALDLGKFKIEGKSEAEISAYFGKVAKQYYESLLKVGAETGDMFSTILLDEMEGVSGDFQTVMQQMAEKISLVGESFKVLNDYLKSDLVKDYATQVQRANETLWQSASRLKWAISDAISGFDGSLESLQKLATLTADRYAVELQLLAQIDAALREITATADGLIEQINLDLMNEQQQYDYYKGLAEKYGDEMAQAVDPSEIERLSKLAIEYAGKAWGLLPDELKASLGKGFVDFLESVKQTAGIQLGAASEAALSDSESIRDNIALMMGQDRELATATNTYLSDLNAKMADLIAANNALLAQQQGASQVNQAQQQEQTNTQRAIADSAATTAALLQQQVNQARLNTYGSIA